MSIFGRKSEPPVRGTANVVTVSNPDQAAGWGRVWMHLVIQVPDKAAYQLQYNEVIRKAQWPDPGQVLPVLVDPSDPNKVSVVWDEVETSAQRASQAAQAMADALNKAHGMTTPAPAAAGEAETATPAPEVAGMFPGAQVIDLRNNAAARDQLAPFLHMVEQMTGQDLTSSVDDALDLASHATIGGIPAPESPASLAASPAAPVPATGGAVSPTTVPDTSVPTGDTVTQLERLAALHSSGSLSDEEFEAAKHKILGTS